jgi:tetratricopeptide (TPR) repeat protein
MFRRYLIVVALCLVASGPAISAPNLTPDATDLLQRGDFQHLEQYFSGIQGQFRSGQASAEELRNAFRAFYPTDRSLAPKYDAWVKTYPNSYAARVARAIYYKKIGYEERGGNYLSETGETQIGKMDQAMQKAIGDFGASIKMDPKPFLSYFNMIDITSSYAGIAYTRQMYDHAINLAPMFVDVRRKYMLALEDKWGGSLEQMQEFFNECKQQALPESQLNTLKSMVYEDAALKLEQSGNLAAAESAYRKAIELGGTECDTCLAFSLSKILVQENKVAEAIPFLDRYVKDHPLDMPTLEWRASLDLKVGNVPEAVADLTKAADAGDSAAQNQLGVLYMTGVPGFIRPDAAKGVELLRQSAAQGNVQARYNLPGAENVLASQSSAKQN